MDDPLGDVSSATQYRALGHPARHRLLNMLRQRPATLAQLAAATGSTKGTVGYHVRVLVDAGFVRGSGTRRVRGGTEQYYAPVAHELRIRGDPDAGAAFLIDAARAEMLPRTPDRPDLALLRHVRLTPDRARALIDELIATTSATAVPHEDGGKPYGLLLAVYRADIPVLPPE